ncbi:MAG: GlsB/YeaQ/YmgE family stress response membrane protein [Clostridia bacterium]
MMFWVVWAVVGVVVWWVMGQLASKGSSSGWWLSLLATLVGSWLGDYLLGDWWWMVAGFNVVAGLIGAVVLNWLWSQIRKLGG